MESEILYMYLLMVLALLISFWIGSILRRSTYERRYEQRLSRLQEQESESSEKLKKIENDLTLLQNLHLDNKESFRIKRERLDGCVNQESLLNIEISDIKAKRERLRKDIPIVDEEINDALADLEKVKNARNSFLEQIEEVNNIEYDISEMNRDIESIEMLVSPALGRKNELTRSLESIHERIEKKEEEGRAIDTQIESLNEEHRRKKFSIELALQESGIEEENYKTILERVEKKMEEGESLSRGDFEGVLKESSSGWLGGFYKKSINLLKGEK